MSNPEQSKLRALGSALIQRFNLATRAGLQFGGKRDLYAVFGYKTVLTYDDFLAKYTRQDIAKRIIDAPPKATWRTPPRVTGGDDFDAAWKKLIDATNLWAKFIRADRLAGLGIFSGLLIGFDSSSKLDTPITNAKGVLYLQPYAETSLTIKTLEGDASNARFGQPSMYVVDANQPVTNPILGNVTQAIRNIQKTKFDVHHSRMLHLSEGNLENDIVGTPRLMAIYNLLDDLLKTVGGSSETYWLTSNRGMQADVDKDMELTPEDAKDLSDEIEEYQHELRRFMRTRGVTIKALGTDTADPSGIFNVLISLLSAETGIPQRILLGSEAGQLASVQDRSSWADRIEERQTDFAEPQVLKPFIQKCVNAGALPEPKDLKIIWPDGFNLSPLETGQQAAQFARSVTNFSRQNQFGMPIVTVPEARAFMGLPIEPLEGMGSLQETSQVIPPQTESDEDDADDKEQSAEEEKEDNGTKSDDEDEK